MTGACIALAGLIGVIAGFLLCATLQSSVGDDYIARGYWTHKRRAFRLVEVTHEPEIEVDQ